ncbi:MAG: hypothetical protein Q8N53_09605, partial [Longimicrobiales bacterium]|nr:hypothetical protein [Longimicrobiales bacterium]
MKALTKYALPGPKSHAILERRHRAVFGALSVHLPAVIERAEGSVLTDETTANRHGADTWRGSTNLAGP